MARIETEQLMIYVKKSEIFMALLGCTRCTAEQESLLTDIFDNMFSQKSPTYSPNGFFKAMGIDIDVEEIYYVDDFGENTSNKEEYYFSIYRNR